MRFSFIVFACYLLVQSCYSQDQQVTLVNHPDKESVDIIINGELFTSFCYYSEFEKPFLFPIHAPNGSVVTRGFPISPRKGERVDHPHHIGLWFNHGNVNGLDFWNNSSAIKDKTKYGHIKVIKLSKIKSGKKAKISYIAEWRDCSNEVLLEEYTTYIIMADKNSRTIDRISSLKALDNDVVFTDNKEGMIAIRVDRAFETPTNTPQIFTDDMGNSTEVKAVGDNIGVNGVYYSSNGKEGDDVWSTRNDWVMLRANKDGTLITFGFFDHPKNIGYPFHSHARGYGLFSSNNIGSQSYNINDQKITVNVKAGKKIKFRHRFYICSGEELTSEQAYKIFKEFATHY